MNNHAIKNINIKNFKCFDDFTADGFGRVNLIGGKNNVGKTAFMEACYINAHAQDIKSFVAALKSIKFMRENLNLLLSTLEDDTQLFIELSNNIVVNSNINEVFYKIKDLDGVKSYHLEFNYQPPVEVNVKDFSFEENHLTNIAFIDNFGYSNPEIVGNYSSLQKKDAENKLNTILNSFDSRIEAFKVIDEKPQCKIDGQYLEITELGDGVRHLVSVVTSLYSSENGYLFIDEIDNGIHYSLLDELWKNISKLSQQLNVQVFATTHSKECIESFNRAQEALNDDDSFYFEMARNIKTDAVFMRSLDKQQLEYELTHQGKYRGE